MKGLAIHLDPESCAYIREGVGEALTGENVGYVWSPEIDLTSRGRRTFLDAEDHRRIADMRGNFPSCATLDPPHAWTLIARKSGELGDRPLGDGTRVCIGESKGPIPMMHGFEQSGGAVVPNKWLRAGVQEDGKKESHGGCYTPRAGVSRDSWQISTFTTQDLWV